MTLQAGDRIGPYEVRGLLVADHARIIAVVKANAYGHGAVEVGRALEAAAARHGRTLACHLKIDTGMNRLGFRYDNLARTIPEVAASRHLRIDAVYTHFATADNPEHPFFGAQRERFEAALATLPSLGIDTPVRHAANSAAMLRDERVWYDFVRPGLLLYGIIPPPLAMTLPLGPALSLHSRIVAVKGLRPGEGTGYGMKTVVGGLPQRRRLRIVFRTDGAGWPHCAVTPTGTRPLRTGPRSFPAVSGWPRTGRPALRAGASPVTGAFRAEHKVGLFADRTRV